MRKEMALLVPLSLMLSILAFAGLSGSAGAQSFMLGPGESHSARYSANGGDSIAYHWTASETVTFTISDPSGNTIVDLSANQRSGIRDAPETGEYLLVWTNLHSNSVTLTYEVTVLPFHAGNVSLFALIAFLLVAIIIIVVIVLIVLVAFRHDRVRTEDLYRRQQPYYVGPQVFPPTPAGTCSRCGAPVQPGGAFCDKCGARLR